MTSKYQYHFTKKEEADLDEILSYISIELSNPDAASSFLKDLQTVIDSICAIPKMGRIVENEFLPDREVRKSLVGNYILFNSTRLFCFEFSFHPRFLVIA